MYCSSCAAEIPDHSSLCPRCGQTTQIRPAKAAVRLDFDGTAMQLLGWMLLAVVACLVIVPLAWVHAATCRWLCRNLKFGDGTTATFRGTGGQVVGWMILYLAVAIAYQVLNPQAVKEGLMIWLLLFGVYVLAITAIALKLIGWFVSNVEFSTGPPLSFIGTYIEFIGWYLLVVISSLTIIGWAWASAGMYRWMARNTHGQGIEFRFNGRGHQILWRTLVFVLASMFIIPLPWMALWLTRWLVRSFSFTRTAVA